MKLNILIHGFAQGSDPVAIQEALKDVHIGRCVFMLRRGQDIPQVKADEMKVIIQEDFSLIDWNEVPSIGEDLIEEMRDCEAVYLDMISREEWRGRVIPYLERKQRYLRHLRYFNHVLESNEINMFISVCLPHQTHSFLVDELCKAKSIQTFYFHHAQPIPDVALLMSDWRDPVPNIKKRMEELKNQGIKGEDVTLSERFEKYYLEHTREREKAKRPWYSKKKPVQRFRPWLFMVLRILKKHPFAFIKKSTQFITRRFMIKHWQRDLCDFFRRRNAKKLVKYYESVASPPDFSKKYVYVPLQVQPEASTCPMAGAFTDTELLVQMLDSLLPDDFLIYIKENPNQLWNYPDGCGRSRTFFDDLLACKKARFVPLSTNTFELTEYSVAVATQTGTAGFEALFREKPVLLFGHRFFQYIPGVFVINSLEDCKEALRKILEEGAKTNLSDLRFFLKALDENSIQATTEKRQRVVTEISAEENGLRIGKALREGILAALPSIS